MSVKTQQVTKEATAKRVQAAPAVINRARGFAGNHTLMRKGSATETFLRKADETTQSLARSENREGVLQRNASREPAPSKVPPIVHEVLRSPGQPLDASTRALMEPRFGHDFGQVRMHTDTRAAESALAVNALAYSTGADVVFGAGRYKPQTETGQRLLAHELTHVVQQSSIKNRPQLAREVSQPSDVAEREADRTATEIMTRSPSSGLVESVGGTRGSGDKAGYKPARISASPSVLLRDKQPWPVNGYVINNSSKSVTVWSDTRGLYTIAAGATSRRFTEDVDHIKDANGQWYKIWIYTVTVDAAGKIHGYKCAVSNFGEDCPKLEKSEKSLAPAVSTGVGPRVIRMPEPTLQRACACGGGCSRCQTEQDTHEHLQAKPVGANDSVATAVPAVVHEVLRSSGQPLDSSTREFMEPRFGHDFSRVHVHTDAQAAESARAVKAVAYTVGRDIVFETGRYAPNTRKGKHLLAHELTHVVQQGFRDTLIQPKVLMGDANSAAEREADRNACDVMRGKNPQSPGGRAGATLQRAETDTSPGCAALADTMDDVNKKINQVMTNARAKIGKSALNVMRGLYKEMGQFKSIGRTGIELWAAALGKSKVRQPEQEDTKYAGVTYGLWNPFFPILNPTMRINNICVGSDKLGHFVQQGFEYYELAHEPGGTRDKAEKYGAETEAATYGLSTTGVFSNADLEANRQGLLFYEDLVANPSLKFNIAQYINTRWNEEINPSHYHAKVGPTVWRNLLNGSWSGFLIGDGGAKAEKVITNFTVAEDAIKLSGEFGHVSDKGKVTRGTITNQQITYQKNALNAVIGVLIDFDWQSDAGAGKGQWKSDSESHLQGKWGKGASANNGGSWSLTKSRSPLSVP